jgi:hypothetical protein
MWNQQRYVLLTRTIFAGRGSVVLTTEDSLNSVETTVPETFVSLPIPRND